MGQVIKLKTREELQLRKAYIWECIVKFVDGGGGAIRFVRDIRTMEQNAKLWPMLSDFSAQVEFSGKKWSKEDWKILLMSAWRKVEKGEQTIIMMGLEGEVVALGYRTSKLGKKDFCSFIEAIYAYGADYGVVWTEKALKAYETYREAA